MPTALLQSQNLWSLADEQSARGSRFGLMTDVARVHPRERPA